MASNSWFDKKAQPEQFTPAAFNHHDGQYLYV
jgi:hypothetical protein